MYTLISLADATLLGEVDLLFAAGVVFALVGEVAFDLGAVLAFAGVDFDGVTGSFLVMEGATWAFFGLSWIGLEILIWGIKYNEITL